MYASKEEARTARKNLEIAALAIDQAIPDKVARDNIKRKLFLVDGFLEAAESKLPRHNSFVKDHISKKS